MPVLRGFSFFEVSASYAGAGPDRLPGPSGKCDRVVGAPTEKSSLPLHAEDLAQLGHDLDQVLLVLHHLLDQLVGAGDLVEHARILAALDALGLGFQVLDREAPPGFAPAHPPAGSVRGALEALRVPQSADDVAAGPHAAGNDAQVPLAGADGPLAGDQDLLAEMRLLRDVVVMAEDGLRELHLGAELPDHRSVQVEHRLPVLHRVPLRPEEVAPVLVHLPGAGEKDGQVPIGQVLVVRQLLRPLDVDLCQRLADVPAAGVEHHPDALVRVQTQLDEVVAAAQRAELLARLRQQTFHGGSEVLEFLPQRPVLRPVHGIAVLVEPYRNRALQGATPGAEVVGKIAGAQAGPHRADSATNVDTHSGRAHGTLHRDHAAHGCAFAEVDVRHCRHMVENPGQRGDVLQLLERDALDLVRAGPRQDVRLAAADPLHGAETHITTGTGE